MIAGDKCSYMQPTNHVSAHDSRYMLNFVPAVQQHFTCVCEQRVLQT